MKRRDDIHQTHTSSQPTRASFALTTLKGFRPANIKRHQLARQYLDCVLIGFKSSVEWRESCEKAKVRVL